MGKITEPAREREAFRYGSSLLADSTIRDGATPPPLSAVKASSDTVLTVCAQLGAFRLGGTRAFLSLFDQRYQHIIAEATCSSTIGGGQQCDDVLNNDLWLSGTAIPRRYSVCERVVIGEANSLSPDSSVDDQPMGESSVVVVPDLALDQSLLNNPYFGVQNPSARFYAGVPIRSRRGIAIGSYFVLGSEPRDSLDAASICFLLDMSSTITTYLETVVASKGHQRNVRMVRGLGSLVEGKGSMSRWWLGDADNAYRDAPGGEGALNAKQQDLQRIDEKHQLHSIESSSTWRQDSTASSRLSSVPPAPTGPDYFGSNAQRTVTGSVLGSSNTSGGSGTMVRSGGVSASENKSTAATSANGTGSSAATASGSVTQPQEDEGLVAIRALLSRGANIIRESVECEGVLFLDAAIGTFGGLVGQTDSDSPSSGESPRESLSGSLDENKRQIPENEQTPKLCEVLGYSTSESASIDGDIASMAHLSVPERFLKRLLRRYPEGHIFNFDETGAVQSGDSSEDDGTSWFLGMEASSSNPVATFRQRKVRQLRPSDGEILAKTFVGARSIALIPLWDSHKEKWFAGGFMWTRTPTRVFTIHGEVSFLKAFGMTIMAEVARIDALRAGKAKADVLGSVSHELRSPLHGIILGIELLNDTKLDAFQEDLLHTLETCGRTLVDTINHLLDFSKINRYARISRRRAGSRNRGVHQDGAAEIETGMMNLYSDISLDSLVEEVAEGVYAGFSYQQLSSSLGMELGIHKTELSRANTLRRLGSIGPMENPNDAGVSSRPTSSVAVFLDIDPSVRWMFYAQPGAIRRVVMNLLGNALKYTSRGFIVVSLTQDTVVEGKKSGRRMVNLSISDSGKGIGADYLKNQLFTPFAQEDQLVTGVGLGLSLVKQITSALGGRISVESQVRRGTVVRVMLPLRRSHPGAAKTATLAESDFLENVEHIKGREVCVIGFSQGSPADNPSSSSAPSFSLKLAMEKICSGWLQMKVVSDLETARPSFYICTEDYMDKIPAPNVPCSFSAIVLVLCRDAAVAHERSKSYRPPVAGHIYEFISQPAGARKLARILSMTLKKSHHPLPPQPPSMDPDSSDLTPPAKSDDMETSVLSEPSPETSTGKELTTTTPISSSNLDSSQAVECQTTFLLVDDNKINLKVLSSYMKKLGRSYSTAENGLEAFDSFRQSPETYRCILMDISMPVMDGLESTRLIRELEQQLGLAPTLVIALTGLASASAQQEAFASGIDIFLAKPVSFAELSRILESKGL